MTGRSAAELAVVETPAAIVDLERVRRNAERVADYCRDNGLAWRPHVKTHKSLDVAQIQLEAGAAGLTVATPREAEVMASVCDDILLAYPPVGDGKLRRLVSLPERVRLTVALDSRETLEGLSRAAHQAGRTIAILAEADTGMRRVGVTTPGEAVALARAAAALPGLDYRGVMFYPGHIRVPVATQGAALAQLADRIRSLLEALADADLAPVVVSGGSTPTLWRSHELPGVTEIRPGTCIYNDRDIAGLGACTWDDIAYTVMATVVSTSVPGQAVVDAGSKALAKETFRGGGEGYGALLDRPDVIVSGLSEEHGILDLSATGWRPAIGDRVRVVPNHVCVSVNLQDRLLVDAGDEILEWPLDGRGRGPAR